MSQNAQTTELGKDSFSAGSKLGDTEIARLLKTVQAAQFRKAAPLRPEDDSGFKPRSLVEIAFAAEQKRQQDINKKRQEAEAAQEAREEQDAQRSAAAHAPATGSDAPDVDIDAAQGQDADRPADDQFDDEAEARAEAQARAEEEARRAAEDDALRTEAEEKGYKRGFEAGLEAARSAEPTAEEKAFHQQREAERADIIHRLEAVIAGATDPAAVDASVLTKALKDSVMKLAARRAGLAIIDNPSGFLQRIDALAETVKSSARQVTVTLNPDDLAALQNFQGADSLPGHWQFREDASFLSGDIKMRLDGIEVSDRMTVNDSSAPGNQLAADGPETDNRRDDSQPTRALASADDNAGPDAKRVTDTDIGTGTQAALPEDADSADAETQAGAETEIAVADSESGDIGEAVGDDSTANDGTETQAGVETEIAVADSESGDIGEAVGDDSTADAEGPKE